MAVTLCVLCDFYNAMNSKDIYQPGTSPLNPQQTLWG